MSTETGDKYVTIFRPYITLPCGKKIWAKWSEKRAFPIRVRRDEVSKD